MDMSRYVELFLTEGREHAAQLNSALLQLGSDPGSGAPLAEAFRAVHSVKGMAAAMGYDRVAETAHSLESELDGLRRGDRLATRELIDRLLTDADTLARSVEAAVRPTAIAGSDQEVTPADDQPRAESGVGRSTHVRVRVSRLDSLMDLVGELEIARGRLDGELGRERSEGLAAAFARTSRLLSDLKEEVVSARMVPVAHLFDRYPRLVRETARTLGKEVDFRVNGADIELDRTVIDRVADPLMHLLRNALDHGIESAHERQRAGKPARGTLTLTASREPSHVLLAVQDDGGGIDVERVLARATAVGAVRAGTRHLRPEDLLAVLTTPGFSTADRVSSVSGRGVGMDVVDSAVRALGGTLDIESERGVGTTVRLRLPLSVAIIPALLARVGGETFAIPFTHIEETVELEPPSEAICTGAWTDTTVGGATIPVVILRRCFGLAPHFTERMKAVTVSARGRRAAFVVDDFAGRQDVVVKPFDSPAGSTLSFAGATVLSDGAPALIIDVNSLI